DKVSYFIGNNFGRQFSAQEVAINPDAFAEGIRAALTGAKPKYTPEELDTAMAAFESMMQAKQAAAQAAMMEKRNARAGVAAAEGKKFLDENGKKDGVVTTPSGLQYEVMTEGKGDKPAATDQVKVHYHGTLLDGTVFDSSVERGEPITFPVQGVIKGWVEALQLMPVGSKWKLFIPSELAYGKQGAGSDIGPDETLVFEVELLGIEGKQ
ncbi:MAG: FKBP-type peptidyl-prolyl cis-trans isomerase, partial [Verrucomicrobiales bacterium]|nr:FKBP-type peptidyl-prolyl cis-trans isomerase [Verrucomicrobiales bacterium]